MAAKKWIAIVIALTAVSVPAWYVASPAWTLYQMKSALEAKEIDRLSSYIDYSMMRDDLKSEVKSAMPKPDAGTPEGAMALVMTGTLVDAMIDNMVTPENIEQLLLKNKAKAEAQGNAAENYEIDRQGLNRFDVVIRGKKESETMRAEFARYGLSWKMVGVELPEELKKLG